MSEIKPSIRKSSVRADVKKPDKPSRTTSKAATAVTDEDSRIKFIQSKPLSDLEKLEIHAWKGVGEEVGERAYYLVYTANEYVIRKPSRISSDESLPLAKRFPQRILGERDEESISIETRESIWSSLGMREGLTLAEAQELFSKVSSSDSFYSVRQEHERQTERKKAETDAKKITDNDPYLKRIWNALPELAGRAQLITPNQTESRIHRAAGHDDHGRCIVLGWNNFPEHIEISVDTGSYFLMDNKGRFYEQRQRIRDDSSVGKYVELREVELLKRVASMPEGNFAHRSRVADKLEKLVWELGGRDG